MAHAKHLIELNGKLYDAASGKLVEKHTHKAEPKVIQPTAHVDKVAHHPKTPQKVQAVDGFAPRKHITVTSKPSVAKTTPHPAHKSVQKSKTLMRTAVKKPAGHAVAHPAITKPSLVSPVRLSRAEKISKSKLISRFGSPVSPLNTQIMPLPVQDEPEQLLEHHKAPVKQPHVHVAQHAVKSTVNFDKALHKAASHEQPKIAKAKRRHHVAKKLRLGSRPAKVAAGLASVLLLAGFFGYGNLPKISMKVAAARAGVDARLPGYRPAGFGLSRAITYSPGQITVNYKSHSDNRAFTLTQKATDMRDDIQVSQQLASNKQSYQTLEAGGHTIYIYDNGNATWLDEGTLYEINSKASLNSEQLLRLASSL